ncbi:TfoX/Sxy family protein [Luteococcus peritonei]|uniref:TfoX/Sxy family protein n=1 Tax=Luteococcus peritonei TaxID=88874 RepID=A0ABW4RQK1_9ACTN
MTDQHDLVDRVRAALREHEPREVRMMGGISFMVDEQMLVAARSGGDLLVRIDPVRAAELLARPGVRPAVMGAARRPMGEGWISVDASALQNDGLSFWLAVALSRP